MCSENNAGKSINFITGNTYNDAAAFIMSNQFGYPSANNNTMASTNETLIASMKMMLAGTANPEVLMPAILEWYPDMNSDDRETREIAMTNMATDWWFGSGSVWEATKRPR